MYKRERDTQTYIYIGENYTHQHPPRSGATGLFSRSQRTSHEGERRSPSSTLVPTKYTYIYIYKNIYTYMYRSHGMRGAQLTYLGI